MFLVWWWCKKWFLTLVERGGTVYVSWDEGGLRLLPHSVVPHPPDAALSLEKSSKWSGLNMMLLLFKTFGPEDRVATWVRDSDLHLFTRFNYPTAWWRAAVKQRHVLLIQLIPNRNTVRLLQLVIWKIDPDCAFSFSGKSRRCHEIPRTSGNLSPSEPRQVV